MVEIRPLAEADRPKWQEMRSALWPDQDPEELAGELTDFLADPNQHALGAFADDRLIGFAECSERPWGEECHTKPVAWLEAIYIEPDLRRGGVGASLVRAVEAWARGRNLRELGSDSLIDNQVSITAHGRWGFTETQRIISFRKGLP